MKITVYFHEPLNILRDMYSEISSDHADIIDVDSNDAGVSFETADRHYIVPMNNIKLVIVDKDDE